MTEREKEMMAFVIKCIIAKNHGIELSLNDECVLYEFLGELED